MALTDPVSGPPSGLSDHTTHTQEMVDKFAEIVGLLGDTPQGPWATVTDAVGTFGNLLNGDGLIDSSKLSTALQSTLRGNVVAYTPTLTGITPGSGGTNVGYVRRQGHELVAFGAITFGSGGAYTQAAVKIGLSFAATGVAPQLIQWTYRAASGSKWQGQGQAAGSTAFDLQTHATTGANAHLIGIDGGGVYNPVAPAAGDVLAWNARLFVSSAGALG